MVIGGRLRFLFPPTRPCLWRTRPATTTTCILPRNLGIARPMHACLNVDEIVRLIARELVASEAKATAVALAGSRKRFEDTVLDALWETQVQPLPLLKSLPGDVWNEGGCTSFKRFPTTQEWARFRKYAQRMRELRGPRPLEDLSLEVLSVLHLRAINEPLFPNLKYLGLWPVTREFIPFIPSLLSQRTTTIFISFAESSDLPNATVASMIATFSTLCPNLESICLQSLPKDPAITIAISGMLLANDGYSLRSLKVDSPLTEEAREMVHKLPNLRELSVVVERDTSLPPLVLPNLTELDIKYEGDWLQIFHGAALGKLKSVTFYSGSEQIGDFLGAFERVALAASAQNTLSWFCLRTSCSWNPNYPSLLTFTQLIHLTIEFSCDDGCSSTVDDDIVTNMAQAMPKLEILELGEPPCHEFPTGVTVKGLAALAHHCPDLSALRVHFQVASLSAMPADPGMTPNAGPAALRRDCALRDLEVGEIPIPEESVLVVAVILALIFPCIDFIDYVDENWKKVSDAIYLSRQIFNSSRTAPENGG